MEKYIGILKNAGWTSSPQPLLQCHDASGYTAVRGTNMLTRNYDCWIVAYRGQHYNNAYLLKHFSKTSASYQKYMLAARSSGRVQT